jgi:hypothetical protein
LIEPTIICPSCKGEVKLTESLAAPLIEATRRQYDEKLARQNAEVAQREAALKLREQQLAVERETVDAAVANKLREERARLLAESAKREQAVVDREAALKRERESLDATVTARLARARTEIAAEEAKKAQLLLGNDLEQKAKEVADLLAVLKSRDEKLAEAQKAQAEMLRKERELEDARRELDLTIEQRVTAMLGQTKADARREAEEALSLKLNERELTIESMKRQIEDLKRKAEQGSQQLQGEALEIQLETLIAGKFPFDTVSPVPKGEHGGDILQKVMTPQGVACGTILWESKRTRNWSDGWLAKLREDQRQAKAEIAVIVSAVLPKEVETFDQIDGVWIVHPRAVLPMAMSLRHMLIEVHCARQAGEGQQTKMEMIYHYLTGPKFRLRVQAIVEAFSTMGEDLAKEKKAIMRQWAKREEQINRVMEATVGMYGEMQGIAGKSLGEIEGLAVLDDSAAAPLVGK